MDADDVIEQQTLDGARAFLMFCAACVVAWAAALGFLVVRVLGFLAVRVLA